MAARAAGPLAGPDVRRDQRHALPDQGGDPLRRVLPLRRADLPGRRPDGPVPEVRAAALRIRLGPLLLRDGPEISPPASKVVAAEAGADSVKGRRTSRFFLMKPIGT